MTNQDFAGQGDALLTEPLRAFRSWTLKIELRDVRGPAARRYGRNGLNRSFLDLMEEVSPLYRAGGPVNYRGTRQYGGTDRGLWEIDQRRRHRGTDPDRVLEPSPDQMAGRLMIPDSPDELTKMTLLPVSQAGSGSWHRDMKAFCLSFPGHEVPREDCTCGIYSWYRPEEARAEHTGIINGVISVLGRTVLGDRGIRSEKARLEAVTINDDVDHLLPFPREVILAGLRQEADRPGGPYEGIVVCDSYKELTRRYRPDLDTVANLLGRDVVDELRYGGRPLAGLAHRAVSAHLVAGARAKRWGKSVTGLRFPFTSRPIDRDDQEDPAT